MSQEPPEIDALIAYAEVLAVELAGMSDDELRESARRIVGPFMHELATRGCSFALHAEDFLVHPSTTRN